MAATANPNEVIQLPRLRPGDLGTLMLELSSTGRGIAASLAHAAKSKKRPAELAALPDEVPAHVLEALHDMEQTQPALDASLRKPETDDGLTPEQRAIDRKLDSGWRCVRQTWELGAERAMMRGDEGLAQRLRDGLKRVLPGGLSFIAPIGRDEFTESALHIGVLEGEQRALFVTLPDGDGLLREIRALHDAYGKAFFITVPMPVSADVTPAVSDAVRDSAESTREYIASVVGIVRRSNPRTRALAERLLAPLANYGRAVTAPAAVPPAPPEDPTDGAPRPPGGGPTPRDPA